MKTPFAHSRNQGGAAAVELAMILPILLLFIFMPLFIGRFFWHYTAAQKAAQDAARYLSTISAQEMREEALAGQAAEVTRQIALAEIEGLAPGRTSPEIIISCGPDPCSGLGGLALPETVSVTVRMRFFDILGVVDTGRYGVPINATSIVRYVGN